MFTVEELADGEPFDMVSAIKRRRMNADIQRQKREEQERVRKEQSVLTFDILIN